MTQPTRIAVIGPVPPIRSGIARHNGALARALAARADAELRVWSFRRQYPGLLYPGAAEREAGGAGPAGLAVAETLDGAGPWTWRRTASAVSAWRPDIAVLPAWTFFVAPALGTVARAARRAGAEVVTVVHNAADHEAAGWKARLSAWQLAAADRFVTHTDALAEALGARFPHVPVAVFIHPVFDDLPEPAGLLPRRAPLELLFFGLVRPYKGLDLALEAVARSGRDDLRLTVAGEFWQDAGETRARIVALGIADRVELIARYVSDAEAAELFHRADAVVLPYRSVTGSGVVPTACRYGRAVVASDLPGLAAAVRPGETGWLVPPGDAGALAAVLGRLDREACARAGRAAAVFGASLGWERFAALVRGGT